VRTRLETRSSAWGPVVSELSGVVTERRRLVGETGALHAKRNAANQEMSSLAKSGDREACTARRDAVQPLADHMTALEVELGKIESALEEHLLSIPNLPHEGAPIGKSEDDNRVVRTWGKKPEFEFEAKPHYELADGLLDFDRASKLSGARFSVLWGAAARLERSLGQLMLNVHTEQHGYTEVAVPTLVRAQALRGTGQLPKF